MLLDNFWPSFIITIINCFCFKTLAQLLPGLRDCGRLKLSQFENRSDTVQPNEFPWMAQIAYNNSLTAAITYRCAAVLINQRYLLTAAHCVDGTGKFEPIAVVFGTISPQPSIIEEIVVHPFLNKRESINDLALLRLNEKLRYSESIRPICLPAANVNGKEFGLEQLIVAGWYLRENQEDIHKLPVVVGNKQDCRRKFTGLVNVTDAHLCGITCYQRNQYRSGSALMDVSSKPVTNYYLAGLLTVGRATCTYPELPDIFTRIDRYMDWIVYNIYE